MIDDINMPPFLRQISILAVVIIFIIGLNFTAAIVAPILLSIFLTAIIVPFLMWLNKKVLKVLFSLVRPVKDFNFPCTWFSFHYSFGDGF